MAYELPSEMIVLSQAAIAAHGRVYSGTMQMSPDGLDVIATALSGHLEVFGIRDPEAGVIRLTEEDYSQGAFRRGATRFEYRNGQASIIVLAVRKDDFARLLDRLKPPRGDPAR